MFTIVNWTRALFAALALTLFAPTVTAENANPPEKNTARSTSSSHSPGSGRSTAEEPHRTGSPEFGVLIIIGVVGFIILVAWLIARIGDDNRPRSDSIVG